MPSQAGICTSVAASTYQGDVGQLVVGSFDSALPRVPVPLYFAGHNVRVHLGHVHTVNVTEVVTNLKLVHSVAAKAPQDSG